jgi:PLP dependent protein
VHSIDRAKIARRLSEQRPSSMPPLEVCIQVNVSGEDSKSGVAPAELNALIKEISVMPQLVLRGLMAIPEPTEDLALQRRQFAQLRDLLMRAKDSIKERHPEQAGQFNVLSMGMSADLESAIQESQPGVTTMVRIGTAIFGRRSP